LDWLIIEGVKPWDGRYEFDLLDAELTTREWGWIKRHSGYLPLTVDKGFAGADAELFACFAAIALRRAGRIQAEEVDAVFERIADAPYGSTIRMESDSPAVEDDAGPPASSSNGSAHSSGPASTTSSEISDGPPNGSGMPDSDSSGSPWARSAT
jgi:hypothetical protein